MWYFKAMTKNGGAVLSRLAATIENDIRRRGLAPGDRYLTAREVGRLLGVSTMTANRALQELAGRRVLVRGRRRGAVVGDRLDGGRPVSLRTVHLLLPSDFLTLEQPIVDLVMSGIHSVLPEDSIQLSFVPAEGDLGFVRRLAETGSLGGAVLLVSSPAVQRFFQGGAIPAVVSGSLHPGISGLAWVDRDQREIGRLLGQAALARRARRVAVLMRDRWGAGDNLMLEGVQAALGPARAEIRVRSFPADPDLVASAVRAMRKSPAPPDAFICRSRLFADAAAGAVGRAAPVLLCDHHSNDPRAVPYPHARPELPPAEQGALIGRMLRRLAEGLRPDPDHVVIPVSLREPGER